MTTFEQALDAAIEEEVAIIAETFDDNVDLEEFKEVYKHAIAKVLAQSVCSIYRDPFFDLNRLSGEGPIKL